MNVNRSNLQWEGNYRMPTIFTFPGTLPAGKTYSDIVKTMADRYDAWLGEMAKPASGF